jgi:hypothetical protein
VGYQSGFVTNQKGRALNGNMQQRLSLSVGGLSSPAVLMPIVWCVALVTIAVGPIDYPGQPSSIVLAVVALGLVLFLLAYWGGKLIFERWPVRQTQLPPLPARTLNKVVMAVSLLGIVGIALIAFDRTILSGVSNSSFAALLRCAPGLVDAIVIKRTPLLYVGYAIFSFGFVSVVLFLMRGEEIRGSAATLAQLSIVSAVGYALLYSGRMPILFLLLLVVAAMLVRLGQGLPLLPNGHRLVLKTVVAVALFAIYSSAIWTSRQNVCTQMVPLITDLQQKPRIDAIDAVELSKRMAEAQAAPQPSQDARSIDDVLARMLQAWNVRPRGYVTSAIESGHLSPRGAMIGLSTYFYLTHGMRTIDVAWQARDRLTPLWGIYEIGVLSPLLRVFFPDNLLLSTMKAEQRSAGIYGFFPTAWAAAFIDFGMVGAIVYVLIWGGVAGWSATGSRRSGLMTPLLLLVFVLTSVMLSPVQGPLGMANSALVLVSMLVTGFVLDFARLRTKTSQGTESFRLNSSAT